MSTRTLIDPVWDYLTAESEVEAERAGGGDATAAMAALRRAEEDLKALLSSRPSPDEGPLAETAERYLRARSRPDRPDGCAADPDQARRARDAARRELDEQLRRAEAAAQDADADAERPTLRRKRILIAVDDSRPSEWAARVGGDLARDLWARVLLVHVVVPATEIADLPGAAAEADRIQRRLGGALLDRTAAALPQGVTAERSLREGVPAGEIGRAAQAWRADLIVMGTRDRGRLARFLLGSTAEAVVRQSACPVMTVAHEPVTARRPADALSAPAAA